MKIGLKLWSDNERYFDEAKRLYDELVYDYIELYIVPGTFDKHISVWKRLDVPYIIHAPHFAHGLNPAKEEDHEASLIKAKEALRFKTELNAKYIIFHPGINGIIENTVKFFKMINDSDILVENKPYYALNDSKICNGNNPEEIRVIMKNAKVGFCFDIGHAIAAANVYKKDIYEFVDAFMKLEPKMCHLSDGKVDSVFDQHLNFGCGNYDFKKIISYVRTTEAVTIETDKNDKKLLKDYEKDVFFLRELL